MMLRDRDSMLLEYQHESKLTRDVLEAVPDNLMSYQASESTHTIRWNVSHLADIPTWCQMILVEPEFDVAPVGQPPHHTLELETVAQAIQNLDKNVAAAMSVIDSFDPSTLGDDWSLKAAGETIMMHPRWFIFQTFMITHVAHHRGHLLAYLAINGVETPKLYG